MKIAFYILTIPIRILLTISWFIFICLLSMVGFICNDLDNWRDFSFKSFETIWKY